MRLLSDSSRKNVWFWAFLIIAGILLVVMPLLSLGAGNSGDEDKFQIPQGRFILDYYKSGKSDTTCMQDVVLLNGKEQSWNLKYYGCSFDVVTEWLNETLYIGDIAKTRHVCNSLMGWLIVLFGGLIARQAGRRGFGRNGEGVYYDGWRAGVIAMALLFFSPRLLGHSFNNPKDIPFAAGIIMFIYYSMMFFRQITPIQSISNGNNRPKKIEYEPIRLSGRGLRVMEIICMVVTVIVCIMVGVVPALIIAALEAWLIWGIKETPRFNPLTLIMLILSLAIAISNRIGGLIVVGYMGLWGLLWMIENGKTVGGKVVLKAMVTAIVVCVSGFCAGIILWPYAMQAPLHNTIESFKLMSQFDVSLRQLFEGNMIMSDQMPWYYTPKYMFMTIPVAVLLGWIAYPALGAFGKRRWVDSTMIYFTTLFPIIWIMLTGANVYGGWRHSIFTYAPMAAAAGLGYDALAIWAGRVSKKKIVEPIVALVPFLLIIPSALHIVRNHPHEYVYFNELSGGVKKAFGRYELDYYYHSMRAATEWVKAHAEPKSDGEKTLVGSWHVESTSYFLRDDTAHFATRFVRWGQRGEYDWDYLVFPLTGVSGEYLKSTHFPPKDCVHTIDVDGVPIALILKRDNKYDLMGVQAMQTGATDSAIVLFNKALERDAYNLTALTNLANIYLQTGDVERSIAMSQKMLEVDPGSIQAKTLMLYGYLNSGKITEAEQLLTQMRNEGSDAIAFSLSAQIAAQRGDMNGAMNYLNKMLDLGLMNNEGLNLYVAINQQRGFDAGLSQYNFYAAYANGLEKKGDKKNAEAIRKQLNGR